MWIHSHYFAIGYKLRSFVEKRSAKKAHINLCYVVVFIFQLDSRLWNLIQLNNFAKHKSKKKHKTKINRIGKLQSQSVPNLTQRQTTIQFNKTQQATATATYTMTTATATPTSILSAVAAATFNEQ